MPKRLEKKLLKSIHIKITSKQRIKQEEILVSWLVTKTIQYSGRTREYNNVITKQRKGKNVHM
jgi:hypothetical protein